LIKPAYSAYIPMSMLSDLKQSIRDRQNSTRQVSGCGRKGRSRSENWWARSCVDGFASRTSYPRESNLKIGVKIYYIMILSTMMLRHARAEMDESIHIMKGHSKALMPWNPAVSSNCYSPRTPKPPIIEKNKDQYLTMFPKSLHVVKNGRPPQSGHTAGDI
jgi:hypothetical protein